MVFGWLKRTRTGPEPAPREQAHAVSTGPVTQPASAMAYQVGGSASVAIVVMNAKGGVGKSTLVLAMAETLSAFHGRKVLVVDSDAQASISHMLLPHQQLEGMHANQKTMVDYLIGSVMKSEPLDWRGFVAGGVSDVDDARSIDLIPSDTHLTLFEREVSKGDHEAQLRRTVGAFLSEAREAYDIVLIDSAPGLSVLTECWLREADFYLAPTRPDHISTRGLLFLRKFRERDPHMGFAELLGVIINMKEKDSPADEQYERWLRDNTENACFEQPIMRAAPLQAAARFAAHPRSFWAKYSGQTGGMLRRLTAEVVDRLAQMRAMRR
jgi:chromosome partitioning protein